MKDFEIFNTDFNRYLYDEIHIKMTNSKISNMESVCLEMIYGKIKELNLLKDKLTKEFEIGVLYINTLIHYVFPKMYELNVDKNNKLTLDKKRRN